MEKNIIVNKGIVAELIKKGEYPNCYKIRQSGRKKSFFSNMKKDLHLCAVCNKLVFQKEDYVLSEFGQPIHTYCLSAEEVNKYKPYKDKLIGKNILFKNFIGKAINYGLGFFVYLIKLPTGQSKYVNLDEYRCKICGEIPTTENHKNGICPQYK